MSDDTLKGRFTRQGEEAVGRILQELLEHPVVSSALTTVFETRERAARAQEVAMAALNLPSASDIERLTRRVRSVSQRLEAIEDSLDRLQERVGGDGVQALEPRLAAIEGALERLAPAAPRRASGAAAKRAAAGRAPQASSASSATRPRRRSAS